MSDSSVPAPRSRSAATRRTNPRPAPRLGLVCLTSGNECRYRSITRTRYLALPPADRQRQLLQLYWDNVARLHGALSFCVRNEIQLYRVISSLFPMTDQEPGLGILRSMKANLSAIGRRAERLGIRVIQHPDQFVVLNSESKQVVRNSDEILEKQGLAFDLMGLPRSSWSAINIHGGKGGRADELVAAIARQPDSVRSRLTLENDERAYGAAEILEICRRAGVPMIFDAHHHVVREGLGSYDEPSVGYFTRAAAETWPDPGWQIVHISNGRDAFDDPCHSQLITAFPSSYASAPWIEVEARGKETAIAALRRENPVLS